jgi:predicted HD superfamily hydrolase involved in NAD metabolism
MNIEAEIAGVGERLLTPARWRHTLGVAETAERIALIYGLDEQKARVAGLLHDLAREYRGAVLLKTAILFGIVLTESELVTPELLHAPVGAHFARGWFSINDADILRAIRWHTLGDTEPLSCALYAADLIEPNRDFPGLDRVRSRLHDGLVQLTCAAMDYILAYLHESGQKVAPETELAYSRLRASAARG